MNEWQNKQKLHMHHKSEQKEPPVQYDLKMRRTKTANDKKKAKVSK